MIMSAAVMAVVVATAADAVSAPIGNACANAGKYSYSLRTSDSVLTATGRKP